MADLLSGASWLFRGHGDAAWSLKSTFERELAAENSVWPIETATLSHFLRLAPRHLAPHLVPHDLDTAAWLGLMQHYGGPTRLLDVSRSPYVALFFAFEPSGEQERAVWAVDGAWCARQAAAVMARCEGIELDAALGRVFEDQAGLVRAVVHNQAFPGSCATFRPFTGAFPLLPWKPDIRQSAQQAGFLCAANLRRTFIDNLISMDDPTTDAGAYKFTIPGRLRREAIQRLESMNVTAATLFPDLGGLARSLRTYQAHSPETQRPRRAPWEKPADQLKSRTAT